MIGPGSAASPEPVGDIVDPICAARPECAILTGEHVSLAPLDPGAHAATLFRELHGSETEQLWRYMSEGPYPDLISFTNALEQRVKSADPLFFTIVDNVSGRPVGLAAYLRIDPVHRTIEVGHILYTPSLQRTVGATEAMYLMARHVFENLNYRRYEWKCNAWNEPSRRAALRLGFTFEGIFRQHMIIKGRNRDTAWFSMLDSEWPDRKLAFERWLNPSNFDESGQQRESLSMLNRRL